MQTITRKLTALMLVSILLLTMALPAFAETNTPTGYDPAEYTELVNFLSIEDANGVSNGSKLNANFNISNPATWSGPATNGVIFKSVNGVIDIPINT